MRLLAGRLAGLMGLVCLLAVAAPVRAADGPIAGGSGSVTGPLTSDLNANANDVLNLGDLDFLVLNCSGLLNGGKLTTDANGKAICQDDNGGGGGGGDGDLAISNPPNFVGRVYCAGGIVDGCFGKAIVTQLNGTVLADGYLELSGKYIAATPHDTTNGFKPSEATFFSTNCNNGAFECGDNFTTFAAAIQTLAQQYDAFSTTGPGKKIRFHSAGYQIDTRSPFKLNGTGWALDFCGGPTHFDIVGNQSSAVQAFGGATGSMTVATHPRRLTCAACGFCGAGTCSDGDELVRPGDPIRLSSSGNWEQTGRTNVVLSIQDDDTIYLLDDEASDYAGTLEAATGKAWVFDATNFPLGTHGTVEILCGHNATINCGGACRPVDTWSTPQLTAPTNRTVPIQGIVSYYNEVDISMNVVGLYGRTDTCATFALTNSGSSSGVHGAFTGGCYPAVNAYQAKMARTSYDAASTADDGLGSAFRVLAPNVEINPRAMGAGNRYVVTGENCGNMVVDGRLAENWGQIGYFPLGCQNVRMSDFSREQGQFCGDGGQPTCETATKPVIEIKPWAWSSATAIAHYDFPFGKIFQYLHPTKFLVVTDTEPVRITLDGSAQDIADLLDVSSNSIEISGRVKCTPHASFPNACDKPALGKYPDFIVTDGSGNVRYDTRSLANLSDTLPLAKLTDDATAGKCLLSGGGGGDPNYQACPGGTPDLSTIVTTTIGDDTSGAVTLNIDPVGWVDSIIKADGTGLVLDGGLGSVTVNAGGAGALVVNAAAGNSGVQLPSGAISSTEIANSGVTADDIADNAVGTGELLDDTIGFADVAYTATVASDPTLGANEAFFGASGVIFEGSAADPSELALVAGALTGDRVITLPDVTGTLITTGDSGTVTSAMIADGGVAAVDIAADSLGAGQISTGGVGSSEIADGSVGTAEIADGTITAADVGADALGAGQIATDAIGSAEIALGAVGADEIAGDAVGSSEIAAGAVGAGEIANAAVETSELADAAVTIPKISATGTPGATNFLRGDGTWATPAGTGTVSAVGPACADGLCLTDGKTTSGSTLFVFEGVTADLNELSILVPNADPGADINITLPSVTGTLVSTGDTATVTSAMIAVDTIGAADIAAAAVGTAELADDSVGFVDVDHSATIAADPTLGAGEAYFGDGGIIFEGGSADPSEARINVATLTADRTYTFPDLSISVIGSESIDTSAKVYTIVGDRTGSGGALVFAAAPTLTGAVTIAAGGSLTITSGCSIDTDVDCPAHATEGGRLILREGADDGADAFAIKVPDGGLTAAPTYTMDATGKLPGTLIQNGSGGTGIDSAQLEDNAVTGAKIALGSDAAGDVMYYNGTDYARLAAGTARQTLRMNSGATAPQWEPGAALLWNGRIGGTIAAGSCFNLANVGSSAGGTLAGTCNGAATNWFAMQNMTITAISAAIRTGATTPATTNGCDFGISINGVTQGSDTDFLDWGAAALDAAGEFQTSQVAYTVTAGDRIEAIMVDAGASQCPTGSGCSCSGTGDFIFQIWGQLR